LWIGCADARVPEWVQRLNNWLPPPPPPPSPWPLSQDQVFVHRNIANQFHLTDSNAVSVLIYRVTGIPDNPIKEVRVVGHTDCGGVKACWDARPGGSGNTQIPPDPVLWTWLGPLRTLAAKPGQTLENLTQENVELQMNNVKTLLGWLGKENVQVKGYVYDIDERVLRELCA
ncbi:Carbonic anhydrase 2, partial [Leucoagaricus sp. SymC.cos]